MSIQYWSRDILLVSLPRRLQEHDDLQRAMEIVRERRDCNVVVDFSRVSVAACATLTRLLQLRQWLRHHRRTLVLCSVAPATKSIFTTTRLDRVFDFVTDRFAARAHLPRMG